MFMLRQWKQQQQQHSRLYGIWTHQAFPSLFWVDNLQIIPILSRLILRLRFRAWHQTQQRQNEANDMKYESDSNQIWMRYLYLRSARDINCRSRAQESFARNEIGDRCLSKCGKESENNFSSPPTKNIYIVEC